MPSVSARENMSCLPRGHPPWPMIPSGLGHQVRANPWRPGSKRAAKIRRVVTLYLYIYISIYILNSNCVGLCQNKRVSVRYNNLVLALCPALIEGTGVDRSCGWTLQHIYPRPPSKSALARQQPNQPMSTRSPGPTS